MPGLADALESICLDPDVVREFARNRRIARPTEDVALDHADPELADQLQVVMSLDALGASVHPECLGQCDDGTDDRGVAVRRAGRCCTPHEALVDLDLVEWR